MRSNLIFLPIFTGFLSSILLLLSWQGVAVAAQPNKPLVFGVYAYIDETRVRAEYQPLIDYVNKTMGEGTIALQVLPMDKFNDAIRDHTVDLATTNPTHFLQLRYQYDLTGVLATRVRKSENQPLSVLAGVIVAKNSRKDINRLSDIQGKTIAIPSKQHLGGYWAQLYEFVKVGTTIKEEDLLPVGTHQKAMEAVLSGKADVGFARTGILELMQAQGSIAANDLKVINAQYFPSFRHKISTELYPEWAIFALNQDSAQVKAVVLALLAYRPAIEQVEDGGILGYDLPADYMKVEALARELRLPPFDFVPEFTFVEAWKKWQDKGVFVLGLVVLLLLLIMLLVVLYRRAQAERYRNQLLLSSLGEGVFGVDKNERCTFINAVALNMLGYTEDAVLGRHQHALFHHHHSDGRVFDRADCPVSQTLQDGQRRSMETHLIRADGSIFPAHLTVAPMLEADKVVGVEVIFQDISQQKAAEARLYQLANFDSLTGCANRRHFMEQLSAYFDLGNEPMALLMLDLDHFKKINDTHGHAVGDAVLQAFSRVLHDKLHHDDVAGRIGGEEFTVLLPNSNAVQAKAWAEDMREAVAALVVTHSGQNVGVTVSVGIAEFNLSFETIDDWLLKADNAVYRAKDSGRNQVVVS